MREPKTCAGRDCDRTITSTAPELVGTGWGVLYVTRTDGVEERSEMVMCGDCMDAAAVPFAPWDDEDEEGDDDA